MNFKQMTVCAAALVAVMACGGTQAAGVSGQGTWETTLQGRDLDGNSSNGYEAFYDTALNITWMADANLLGTRGLYSAGYSVGRTTFADAAIWVSSLNYFGTTGWRLPTMYPLPVSGCYNGWSGVSCVAPDGVLVSEMAHLYHVTLGVDGVSSNGRFMFSNSPSNTGPFKNVQADWYWADPQVVNNSTTLKGYGGFKSGGRTLYDYSTITNSAGIFVWAVKDGDVAVVPEPGSLVLLLAGAVLATAHLRRIHPTQRKVLPMVV